MKIKIISLERQITLNNDNEEAFTGKMLIQFSSDINDMELDAYLEIKRDSLTFTEAENIVKAIIKE